MNWMLEKQNLFYIIFVSVNVENRWENSLLCGAAGETWYLEQPLVMMIIIFAVGDIIIVSPPGYSQLC